MPRTATLAKDPNQRPETAAELATALRACEAAGSWSSADADRWWINADKERAPEPAVDPSGEQPRLTVCAVDLARRLAERQRSA